jgi:hypothetical protein
VSGFEELIFGTAAGTAVGHGTNKLLRRHGLIVVLVGLGAAYVLYHRTLTPRNPGADEVLAL